MQLDNVMAVIEASLAQEARALVLLVSKLGIEMRPNVFQPLRLGLLQQIERGHRAKEGKLARIWQATRDAP